ncbi:MAG: hypothetical protein JWN13_198 [Betaproteobacteria bacterium]|nr:hypothetical protein [Betaproteobacteria bacterium]
MQHSFTSNLDPMFIEIRVCWPDSRDFASPEARFNREFQSKRTARCRFALCLRAVLRRGRYCREERPEIYGPLQSNVAGVSPCWRALDVLHRIFEVTHTPRKARCLVYLAYDVELMAHRRERLALGETLIPMLLKIARHNLV